MYCDSAYKWMQSATSKHFKSWQYFSCKHFAWTPKFSASANLSMCDYDMTWKKRTKRLNCSFEWLHCSFPPMCLLLSERLLAFSLIDLLVLIQHIQATSTTVSTELSHQSAFLSLPVGYVCLSKLPRGRRYNKTGESAGTSHYHFIIHQARTQEHRTSNMSFPNTPSKIYTCTFISAMICIFWIGLQTSVNQQNIDVHRFFSWSKDTAQKRLLQISMRQFQQNQQARSDKILKAHLLGQARRAC